MADKKNDCGCGCIPLNEKDSKKATKGKKEVRETK